MTADPTYVIKGGRLVDATGIRSGDVVIGADGTIVAVGPDLDAARTLDAAGCVVSPGFVDIHSHLRQPGREEAETVETGARGAAVGGYTCILAMPNTTPAIDSAGVAREVLDLGRAAPCDVRTSGAITVDRAGERLAPMAELAALGVRVFTDDGTGVQDNLLMRRAMEYAVGLGVTLAQHCEDDALCSGGHMHEGEWSSRLGIAGQPAEAEELMVMRDIALARLTGCRVHFQHLSTQGSLAMIAGAKAGGLPVTCEATTHHFTLTDANCATYDPMFKVNPPLRTDDDVAAVKAGIAEGTVDCIATDHAPHAPDTKHQPFDDAPPGMLGLETALALALTELDLEVDRVVGLLSWKPAAIIGVDDRHGLPVAEGNPANLCVFDPEEEWVVDGVSLQSRSRNTPYQGRRVRGRVRHTILEGDPTVIDREPVQ
ncbi:MAG: dihydroorotase [Acidimicrobiales bacterium]|nr:dihydroorotase [Acidimicrobiales bacterium]